jgi:hypothetical protein
MERDASLDEFLDSGGSDDDASERDTEEISEQDDGSESVDSDEVVHNEPIDESDVTDATSDPAETVDPARSTGRWDPEGIVCDACGSAVTRRWREDEEFRCVECKSW